MAYLSLRDMFDGGGAGKSGDTFQGGPFSGMLNTMGVKPLGYYARQSKPEDTSSPAAANNLREAALGNRANKKLDMPSMDEAIFGYGYEGDSNGYEPMGMRPEDMDAFRMEQMRAVRPQARPAPGELQYSGRESPPSQTPQWLTEEMRGDEELAKLMRTLRNYGLDMRTPFNSPYPSKMAPPMTRGRPS
jgi:hypothetical protein